VLGILHLLFPQGIALFSTTMKAGGILGKIIADSLTTYLNYWGSVIMLLMLLTGGVMLGYEPQAALRSIARSVSLVRERLDPRRKVKGVPRARQPKEAKETTKPRPQPRTDGMGVNEPRITLSEQDAAPPIEVPKQTTLEFIENYQLPPLSLLDNPPSRGRAITEKEFKANASLILSKLRDFGVEGEILEIRPGPVITMYEFTPAPGIKITKIVSLADDLAMALKVSPVRVVAPIPGKNAVGIEIPNRSREIVHRGGSSPARSSSHRTHPPPGLGTDIEGTPVVTNLAKMPHLLIGGATGMGQSVGLNAMILSPIYKNNPSDLKFIMIDPKRIELSHYEGIPHLLHPVVTDPKQALPVLKWAVLEMEERYALFKEYGLKGIDSYNKKVRKENTTPGSTLAFSRGENGRERRHGLLPKIVIVIDEMADLMMVIPPRWRCTSRGMAPDGARCRMHLIVPSEALGDVITASSSRTSLPHLVQGVLQIDSRTILDSSAQTSSLTRRHCY
jgi:S-DNA-T family DNA segregation ATPase FtsK/SpoIIIE